MTLRTTMTTLATLAVFATTAQAQDLLNQSTSEILTELSYLQGEVEAIDMTSNQRSVVIEGFTQTAVCNELTFDDFKALGAIVDLAFGNIANGAMMSSVSSRTYADRMTRPCGLDAVEMDILKLWIFAINRQMVIREGIVEREAILFERFMAQREPSALDAFMADILALPVLE
ncbi:hypothetical protein OA238_c26350 [Octadecabacter arcticus 238]|uniref:Uncharacterized protein n=1 Tax=Octadecabacter arcticus 238 TaxID=391616 RepID=M9RS78_9RHOB|nr:hypothetical protein [Octadecabacter arcticus]AGI72680.1 hypothetical protein OA238_c26350 [Octadecabacter arcticus 238]